MARDGHAEADASPRAHPSALFGERVEKDDPEQGHDARQPSQRTEREHLGERPARAGGSGRGRRCRERRLGELHRLRRGRRRCDRRAAPGREARGRVLRVAAPCAGDGPLRFCLWRSRLRRDDRDRERGRGRHAGGVPGDVRRRVGDLARERVESPLTFSSRMRSSSSIVRASWHGRRHGVHEPKVGTGARDGVGEIPTSDDHRKTRRWAPRRPAGKRHKYHVPGMTSAQDRD